MADTNFTAGYKAGLNKGVSLNRAELTTIQNAFIAYIATMKKVVPFLSAVVPKLIASSIQTVESLLAKITDERNKRV